MRVNRRPVDQLEEINAVGAGEVGYRAQHALSRTVFSGLG
jgi:hypothetical protein